MRDRLRWERSGDDKNANALFVPYQVRKDGGSSIFRSDEEAGLSMLCILCVWDKDKSSAVISSLNFFRQKYGRETGNAEA
jgi:hypothetical protein